MTRYHLWPLDPCLLWVWAGNAVETNCLPENRLGISAIKMEEPPEPEELCLEWNEYINILSVARNQISLWFIELIYGFLSGSKRPDPQTPGQLIMRPTEKINKNISYTKIWVEWMGYGNGVWNGYAFHKRRTQLISGYLYLFAANELFRNQSPAPSYEDCTRR